MDTIVINVTPPPEIVLEINEGGVAADRAEAAAAAAQAAYDDLEPHLDNIDTVADNIADVNTVADNIADVQFVADASLEEVSTSGTAAVEEITATDIKFGDDTNYSKFDADGTLRMYGTATVFDDSMVPATVFRTGGTALAFVELVDGIFAHRMDVNDVIHFMVQFPHRMKIDSTIFPHIHIINQAAIVGAANVTFTLRYTWANINASFPAVTPDANVILDLADADALTHSVKSFAAIVPVAGQGGFSSILVGSLERVNSGYTANNIFLGGFDIHYEVDSLGTKEEYVK